MTKFFKFIGLVFLVSSFSLAAWDKGFNFRATSGYVTDGTDQTYVLATESYPQSRNGVTFGWSTAPLDSRDRTTGSPNNPRLSGINFSANAAGTTPGVFRVDLPATGKFDLYMAFGDSDNGQAIDAEWADNASYTTVANNGGTIANSYFDATGALRTAAQWVADSTLGGTKVSPTFASQILNIRVGGLTAIGSSSCVAHLFVSQVASASSPPALRGLIIQ